MSTPPVENLRRGFFERPDFERVVSLFHRDLGDAARFAFRRNRWHHWHHFRPTKTRITNR
jgi:hypothetical protein